ncbi:MAG: type II restriction endonuclease [Gammaproteobacteria bacterium]|nr:type II restriction endonuclease [Gammaproteobacteria bacterium]MCY4166026.1 type II restriction endonuclease [Gammaproteobacteria bacterium]MCY4256121.1 type II restriction endonuclease [Gammaproteobacteria bacterium]MCY4341188.1 type II restriction endonuclease [Gammaproteobacteria bacterium]
MRRGQLRDCFVGVGVKRLSAVDAEPRRSNQHEVGTTRDMRRQFLGEIQHQRFRAIYVWLGKDHDRLISEGTATHYDAREQKVNRAAEWRLYYSSNPVTEAMREGDTLFLAMTNDQSLYFIVAPTDSTSERQLSWLFDLHPSGRSFVSREVAHDEQELDFAARFILDEIGIELEEPDADKLDAMIEPFGMTFPKTVDFSDLARRTLPAVRAEDDPDMALVEWLRHEEALFRRLERRIVAARLDQGFRDDSGATDVNGFISFSLSVHNRRKSRMGHSLELHLEAVFRAHEIAYVRGAITENNQKPDFLFPNEEAYRAAPEAGHTCLTMLGAKSSCKDRWRQVLAEAAKIPRKHLLTLEPGISERQTSQMANLDLQLVVPHSIQKTYTNGQRAWLWNVNDFIQDVRARACK